MDRRGWGRLIVVCYALTRLGMTLPPTSPAPQALAEAAYKAMGLHTGDEFTTLSSRGVMRQWDPGGSHSVSDVLKPDLGSATFTNLWHRTLDAWRTEWARPGFLGGTRNYTEIYTRSGGYVTGVDVNTQMPRRTIRDGDNPPIHTMSGVRLRALVREQTRHAIVIRMHEHPERLMALPDQTIGGKTYPAVQYQDDNGAFIVMFDPATHLPVVVRTRDFDAHMGDANYDAAYSDWREVDADGLKQPFRIVYTLNGVNVFEVRMEHIARNIPVAVNAFTLPARLQGEAVPAAASERTPFQWVIRRLANGFYLDSDALYTDDGGTVTLTDVGPDISLVTGGSHNALIVATQDSLIAFDAPGDDGLTEVIIRAARQKYPNRPFRFVVLTHHHLDHTGGIRGYAEQGASVVVGKGDAGYFRKVLAAPRSLSMYGARSITTNVIEVDGKWSAVVGGRAIEAYSLQTPHATGYLVPYIPDAKMAFQTDLWFAGTPLRAPTDPAVTVFMRETIVALVDGLRAAGVAPDAVAGGHGPVAAYPDLVRYAELIRAVSRSR